MVFGGKQITHTPHVATHPPIRDCYLCAAPQAPAHVWAYPGLPGLLLRAGQNQQLIAAQDRFASISTLSRVHFCDAARVTGNVAAIIVAS